MGPGGMGQSGGHAPSNLNDNIAPGLPPASMMQSQMSNGEMLTEMGILQINSGPHELYFLHKPRRGVLTSSICPSLVLSARLILTLLHVCAADIKPSFVLFIVSCKFLWPYVQLWSDCQICLQPSQLFLSFCF